MEEKRITPEINGVIYDVRYSFTNKDFKSDFNVVVMGLDPFKFKITPSAKETFNIITDILLDKSPYTEIIDKVIFHALFYR